MNARAGSRSELAPQVARQYAGNRGHNDEEPEGSAGCHHLLEQVEHALGQVLGEHPIDEHVHKPQHCIAPPSTSQAHTSTRQV